MSETKLTHLDTANWVRDTFCISPDSRHVAYALEIDQKLAVLLDGTQ